MGLGDRAAAARLEAARRARNVAARRESQPSTVAHETVARTAAAARQARARVVAGAAGTRAGRVAGHGVGTVGRHLSGLPVLTLPRAVMEERRGHQVPGAAAAAAPRDPLTAIRLAEALAGVARDGRLYLAARTLWNPWTAAAGELLKVTAAMEHGEHRPHAELVVRHAYALAVLRLREDPDDADALHTVARVFRAVGSEADGLVPCRAAVGRCASPAEAAHALYTLSDLALAAGDVEQARRAAQASIRAGCSLGHQTLAELVFRTDDAGSPMVRARRFAELVADVDPADERAYWGFARPDARELLRAVVDDQAAKASGTYRSMAARYDAVRRRITST